MIDCLLYTSWFFLLHSNISAYKTIFFVRSMSSPSLDKDIRKREFLQGYFIKKGVYDYSSQFLTLSYS